MSYKVKEIFCTLQGEGFHAGRAAVFCRFSGCNLWSGLEKDRSSAICQFCDTDFVGGKEWDSAGVLALSIRDAWEGGAKNRFVVFTGGEPLLQLDEALCLELSVLGFEVAVETNGTIPIPNFVDWVCMSPKAGAKTVVTKGNELKLVYPQPGIDPKELEDMDFEHFFIQPMDGVNLGWNRRASICFVKNNPRWRLSTQTHKILDIP